MKFHMELPPAVQTLLGELSAAGHTAYVVGGAVRDAAMGKTPHDYDITTSALPAEMQKVFAHRPVIETGLKHGTLTVLLDHEPYEITTYRVDGLYEDSRHPAAVRFVDNIEEDLSRRDFTVNAMAYNETSGLVDPFDGALDAKDHILRCVGDPEKRLTEDALRILRGVRFAAQSKLKVEESTEKAMFLYRDLLKNVSAERQNAEFSRLLTYADAPLLTRYREILAVFLPEIRPMFDFDQKNDHHKYDVWEHTVHAVEAAPENLILRLALFFHDIGKPQSFTIDENGVGHFYDHAKAGKAVAEAALKRLKYDNRTVSLVTELVEFHGLVPYPSMKYTRKLLAKHGEEQLRRLLIVAKCDLLAQGNYESRQEALNGLDILKENMENILAKAQCFTMKDLALNGHDVMVLGVKEGKTVGTILQALLELVLEEPHRNTREELTAAACEMISKKEKI